MMHPVVIIDTYVYDVHIPARLRHVVLRICCSLCVIVMRRRDHCVAILLIGVFQKCIRLQYLIAQVKLLLKDSLTLLMIFWIVYHRLVFVGGQWFAGLGGVLFHTALVSLLLATPRFYPPFKQYLKRIL